MNREQAEASVAATINRDRDPGDRFVVLSDATQEHDFGWVVFYQTEKYVETGEFAYALAGNAPYIVERSSGRILVTGTALPVEAYIASYRETGDPRNAHRNIR